MDIDFYYKRKSSEESQMHSRIESYQRNLREAFPALIFGNRSVGGFSNLYDLDRKLGFHLLSCSNINDIGTLNRLCGEVFSEGKMGISPYLLSEDSSLGGLEVRDTLKGKWGKSSKLEELYNIADSWNNNERACVFLSPIRKIVRPLFKGQEYNEANVDGFRSRSFDFMLRQVRVFGSKHGEMLEGFIEGTGKGAYLLNDGISKILNFEDVERIFVGPRKK